MPEEVNSAGDSIDKQRCFMQPLYETMLGLINRLDINDLLTEIIHRAAAMGATEHAFIYLVKPNEFIMDLALGIGRFQKFSFSVRKGSSMVGIVWETGKPLIINNYCEWEGKVLHPFFSMVKAAIAVPLLSNGQVLGVIGLDCIEDNRKFDSTQVEMLCRFAEVASLALENAKLYSGVKQELVMRENELTKVQRMLARAMGIDNVGIFSNAMRQISILAQKYHENRDLPVLIEGETGTGKELVAKIIHYGDMRNPEPFIDINCATMSATLFESELFGYEAGAFTGALHRGQKGKFDLARGGTLFLDEITEIPLELQPKLLRVIQEKEYFRVGGLQKIKTDVRIICATNLDLGKQVELGKFRKDLYYRLKVGHIFVSPLRDRREEILPMAAMFLQEMAAKRGKKFTKISAAAQRILLSYDWPGNVRELRNMLEWVVALNDDEELQASHLAILEFPSKGGAATEEGLSASLNLNNFVLPPGSFCLEDFFDRIILQAVEMHDGNKTKAANYLGISRRAVYYRMKRLRNPQ